MSRNSGTHGTRTGSRLFVAYAAASLVSVIALGAVLLQGARDDAASRGRDQGLAQAAVIEEMAIGPALDGADLNLGLSATQRDRLQAATDLAIFHGSVIRLRVRSFSGKVAFSDDGSTVGGVAATDPAFRSAAIGHAVVKVVPNSERSIGQVIRVLQPIIAGADGQAIGVLELYLPYESIAAHLQGQMRSAYLRLGAGLLGLYVVLALISWSTTRSLRRHAARREHEALHDGLTGLPNRDAFRQRAESAVDTVLRGGGTGAIVLLDLDRFKEVNDTLGHHAGDELLRVVAGRLVNSVRSDDVVARLGGDEFGLVLPGLGAEQAHSLLARVRDAVSQEMSLEGVPLTIEASFGIALYPEHGGSVEELLRRADAAMYQGKRGASSIVLYSGETVAPPTQWLRVQTELRHAIERDELVLLYQPKIRLADGEAYGVEALVRWQHPQRGLLPPPEFLPAAEQSGLIEPLTAWVLRRALADQALWTSAGRTWSVSVNVSARNLEAPGFARSVAQVLAEFGTPPQRLTLEVTETAMANDAHTAVRVLGELAALGVDVAVDDFGIGYTCLSQLRTLAVREIKIDRAFVNGIEDDAGDRAIVRSVIELAHGLGCRVTAEGVETPQAQRWLADAGCDDAQGFLFSRPAPWAELVDRFDAPETTAPIVPAPQHEEGLVR
ncbi:putative bifunctional diguanylate cyclase/phosphodiesterase [Krasilnikovia sp. MM14-A1259]|uniref:putative bifunctional diguanylate cyclase/phosphodiesterase n=1 Tax=Krasilnikovia sp. MM14-A1259 TaxID=3373539 RepID=UPI00380E8022